MRKVDLLIILATVALGAGFWFKPQTTEAPGPTPGSSFLPPQSITAKPELYSWSVDGATLKDTPLTLTQRYGQPTRVKLDKDVDQYWYRSTSGAEIHVSYFQAEKTMGIAGDHLSQWGEVVAQVGDSTATLLKSMGEPPRRQTGEDFVAFQYEGARIYLRNDKVFGVVIEGSADSI